MKSVFVIWQNLDDRMWHPVAKLTSLENGNFIFNYTNGAKHKKFVPFPRMLDLGKEYVSNALFPFFKNRIMTEKRPEYASMLEWSGLDNDDYSPLSLLAITGGIRKTDNFKIISIPENINGNYTLKFFVNGIRYLSEKEKINVNNLSEGQELSYMYDGENKNDNNAIIIFDSINALNVGYYPRYLNRDFSKLEGFNKGRAKLEITVIKVNKNAPEQYRLLCQIKTSWPDGFMPFKSREYFDYRE